MFSSRTWAAQYNTGFLVKSTPKGVVFCSRSCAVRSCDSNLPWCDVIQADDRRLAELHYKMCLTLQYLDQPEDSLKEIKVGNFLAVTLCVPGSRGHMVFCASGYE